MASIEKSPDLLTLSELRGFAADVLAILDGDETQFDWPPRYLASVEQLEVDRDRLRLDALELDTRIQVAMRNLTPTEPGEWSNDESTNWRFDGVIATWTPSPTNHRPTLHALANRVMGRGFESGCPIGPGFSSLLYPTYEAVVPSLSIFGAKSFPGLWSIQTAIRSLVESFAPSAASVMISAFMTDDLFDPNGQECLVAVQVVERDLGDQTPIEAGTATAEHLTSSPLSGIPILSRTYRRALQAQYGFPESIIIDEAAMVREGTAGALVWMFDDTFRTPALDSAPTRNALISRASEHGPIQRRRLHARQLLQMEGPAWMVAPTGTIIPLLSIDDVTLTHRPESTEQLARALGLTP